MRSRIQQTITASSGEHDNFALVLYRFIDGSGERSEGWAEDIVKRGTAIMRRQQDFLNALTLRQQATLASWQNAGYKVESRTATVDWRLVVGGSYGRVWDVASLQVHPLYGIPWLPPSAIKGILHHYATEENKPNRDTVFGNQDQSGDLIVFDAFCLGGTSYFEVDIINKHYSEYYDDRANTKPPADYYEPKLIKFPVIGKGVKFQFHFASREKAVLDQVTEWLKDALEWRGIGAKTRVGYGRMEIAD